MPRESKGIAKARVEVRREGGEWLVMARKRAPGKPEKHGKLEMPGGRLEPGETPRQALVRELREEEATGRLAEAAERQLARPREFVADGEAHHLFDLEILEEEYRQLRPSLKESLGFELVPRKQAEEGELDARLTPRTREIFRELRSREV